MSYLVDTHCLIWSLLDPDKLSRPHRDALLDRTALKYVSKISYWEIALKYSLGKLFLKGITPEQLFSASIEAGYETLDLGEVELVTSYQLSPSKTHKDPFDRLLVWQCIRNDLVMITADQRIREYKKDGLKIVEEK